MARLASLISTVLEVAFAFSIGWVLGYVLAPMGDPRPTNVTIHNPSTDPIALRKSLEHTHPASGLQTGAESPPVWTADVMRRRGEQV